MEYTDATEHAMFFSYNMYIMKGTSKQNWALLYIAFCLLITTIITFWRTWEQTYPPPHPEPIHNTTVKTSNEASVTLQETKAPELPLSITENVGQMLMIGYWGTDSTEALLPLIAEGLVGGVMLMNGNVGATDEVTAATVHALKAAVPAHLPPLLVAIDQEGGIVSRLPEDDTMLAQPAIASETAAYETAYTRGARLHDIGIDINFAPVLEHITNSESFLYDRTFRVAAEAVGPLGTAMVRGYADTGVTATLKHFPGHHNDSADSHESLPISNSNTPEALRSAIAPFSYTLRHTSSTPLVMTSHVSYPHFDANFPASLSAYFINDLLRTELGFDGVVITDDLNMGAITETFTRPEAIAAAVHAGSDILLFVVEPSAIRTVHQTLMDLVDTGRITETRIDESLKRIMILKSNQ